MILLDVELLLILQQTDDVLHLHHRFLAVDHIQLVADVQLTHLDTNNKRHFELYIL